MEPNGRLKAATPRPPNLAIHALRNVSSNEARLPGRPAGRAFARHGMRYALLVHLRRLRFPGYQSFSIKGQTQQPAAFGGRGFKTIENEITQAVNNQFATVIFRALGDVRMAANNEIGAGIDHHSRQLPLAFAGLRLQFPAPVHEGNDQVGPGRSCGANVADDLAILAPGYPRQLGPASKERGLNSL